MADDGENYRNMDQQQFNRRRAEDEARQDALLDQIHGGVVGLKNQAHAINDEVVEQNVIIDDIDTVREVFFSLALFCLKRDDEDERDAEREREKKKNLTD